MAQMIKADANLIHRGDAPAKLEVFRAGVSIGNHIVSDDADSVHEFAESLYGPLDSFREFWDA